MRHTRCIGRSPPSAELGWSVRSHTTQEPPANGSGTVPPPFAAGRVQHDVVEHRRMGAGLAEQPEHQRDCEFGHFVEHLEPAQVGQRGVEAAPDAAVIVLRKRLFQ